MKRCLGPIAWTTYHIDYPDPVVSRYVVPAVEVMSLLNRINFAVNKAIAPNVGRVSDINDTPWRLWPGIGWCHDYAVTKRACLLDAGVPVGAMGLVEVQLSNGEHHLMLRVQVDAAGQRPVTDTWLCNLQSGVRLTQPYKLIRQQVLGRYEFWEQPDDGVL